MVAKRPKVFVLDTSVIIYDHSAITHFDEHDVAIPITVLEELDQFKKGNDIKNYSAREFIRFIDGLSEENSLKDWVPLNGPETGRVKVINDIAAGGHNSEEVFGASKPDHRILNAALTLSKEQPESEVVLVTKDISLRLKARAMGLEAQDYIAGKVREDIDAIYPGRSLIENVKSDSIDEIFSQGMIDPDELPASTFMSNHFYVLKNGKKSALACYDGLTNQMQLVTKRSIYGIEPRNAEQTFAIHAIMNPNIRLVTLQGVAGTGKTLLALAGAIEQRKQYRQIYLARPIVPLSNKDIGYLPGDINSKVNPYMEPLWDNLRYIKSQFSEHSKEFKQISEMVETQKIEIIPLTYIRGRSLSNVIIIIDESQNLTPHEVKTIITRAGENTKLIFTGDVHQIDTPYLDTQSNGLSHLIEKLKDHPLFAHVTLEKGERSELANLANELL